MKYTVFVKFDKDNKIEIKENDITISLKSKPDRGRANRELIQRLIEIGNQNKKNQRQKRQILAKYFRLQ